ncbi:MAG: alkene reductase [Nocardioidaceae bacterium]
MRLMDPVQLGAVTAKNRVVMAPMTRSRSPQQVPVPLAADYYAQRAGAGLIVTEGTQVSELGAGYPMTPGIHTDEQVAGWRAVTDAVHSADGLIFAQLWHVGRMGHPSVHGQTPVAPSAVAPGEDIFTAQGMQPIPTPRALGTEELPTIVEQFRYAARQARSAGFDGVEVHGANGYLLDQFLQSGSNQRTDGYGGSTPNRARLLLEVTEAVIGVWGADRVGVRLSPGGTFSGMSDADPVETFGYAMKSLDAYGLAYLHVVETTQTLPPVGLDEVGGPTALARSMFTGPVITAGEYGRDTAEAALADGRADLVAFARHYLANPDLTERFRLGADLNEGDPATYYGGGAEGYTDYPTLAGS